MGILISTSSSAVLGNFILVTASFVILVILIRVFAWDRITGIFEERANKIAKDIDSAEERLTTASNLVQQREEELKKGRTEAQQMVQDAVEHAKQEQKKILKQTNSEVQGLKRKTQQEIEVERREVQEHLRLQVADMAIDLAGKIILKDLNKEEHSQLIDRYLDKLGDE